jgi:hypothetical protein
MSSLPANGFVCLLTAVAASCWDGALDPISFAADSGDSDTDTDTDTDTGSVVDTDPVPCSVSVPIYDPDNGTLLCSYAATGTCVEDAAICVGCAWSEEVVTGCADGQSCCVDESEFQPCTTWLGWGPPCGYEEAESCTGDLWGIWSTTPSELPVCPGGTFCCSSEYEG